MQAPAPGQARLDEMRVRNEKSALINGEASSASVGTLEKFIRLTRKGEQGDTDAQGDRGAEPVTGGAHTYNSTPACLDGDTRSKAAKKDKKGKRQSTSSLLSNTSGGNWPQPAKVQYKVFRKHGEWRRELIQTKADALTALDVDDIKVLDKTATVDFAALHRYKKKLAHTERREGRKKMRENLREQEVEGNDCEGAPGNSLTVAAAQRQARQSSQLLNASPVRSSPILKS